MNNDVKKFIDNYQVNGWYTDIEGIAKAMEEYAEFKIRQHEEGVVYTGGYPRASLKG